MAWATGVPSLAVLPAVLGVFVVSACVQAAGEGQERADRARVAGAGLGGGAVAPAG